MTVITNLLGLCECFCTFGRLTAAAFVLYDKQAWLVDRHDAQAAIVVGQAQRCSCLAGQRKRDRRRENAEPIDDGQKPARPPSIRSGQAQSQEILPSMLDMP